MQKQQGQPVQDDVPTEEILPEVRGGYMVLDWAMWWKQTHSDQKVAPTSAWLFACGGGTDTISSSYFDSFHLLPHTLALPSHSLADAACSPGTCVTGREVLSLASRICLAAQVCGQDCRRGRAEGIH